MKEGLSLINGVCLIIICMGIYMNEINIIPCMIILGINAIYFFYKFF